MSVTKNKRALLAVISVKKGVSQHVQWLYQTIETLGQVSTDILGTNYVQYRKLVGDNATKAKFLNDIKTLGNSPSIKAIDVIVMLHGQDNKLVFADATHNTQQLSAEILALNLKNKLRLLYSTACFGRSHADDFVNRL